MGYLLFGFIVFVLWMSAKGVGDYLRTGEHASNEGIHARRVINPATGLPMITNGRHGIDISGNSYGTNDNDD